MEELQPAGRRWRKVLLVGVITLAVTIGGSTIYLKAAGVQIFALITASQTPALPTSAPATATSATTAEASTAPAPTTRPIEWATPLQHAGLPNLHRVDTGLYRGAQPTPEGIQELKKMGIKTIINLRTLHSDRDGLADTGLAYETISFATWHPEDDDIVRFLQIVTDKTRWPIFVHCQHGSDRTGTMCAIYRIAVQGWSKDEAIREMTQGGFGFHEGWQNLLIYLRKLDVPAIKHLAGLQ